MKLLSIVVPCYNEESVLNIFYNEIRNVMNSVNNINFELLFIDDGSSDKTLTILKELAKKDCNVYFTSFSRNFGKEAGIFAGLSNAKGDIVVIMDCDMQDPPLLLPEMLSYIEQGYDSVATRRVNRKGESPIRSVFARLFYFVINKLSDADIVDGARDYRMMTRQMVDSILQIKEYHRFSKGIFGWVGYTTKWVEFENIKRIKGETKWSFWKLFKYALEGVLAFTTIPLRFASISGTLISLVGIFYMIYTIIKTNMYGIDVPGYASTLVIVLFLGGIQLLSIGIIGEYLSKAYMEIKARPKFIVKETNINESYKQLVN